MIVKLHPEGALKAEVVPKLNEIIDVVNAITDGAEVFADAMDREDFQLTVMENLRTAEGKVKS